MNGEINYWFGTVKRAVGGVGSDPSKFSWITWGRPLPRKDLRQIEAVWIRSPARRRRKSLACNDLMRIMRAEIRRFAEGRGPFRPHDPSVRILQA